jgi:ATPase family associated with various cellular activities (AAA)
MTTVTPSNPFSRLDWTPANHFRLRFFETVAQLRSAWPDAVTQLPFLAGYYAELDAGGSVDLPTFADCRRAWEESAPRPLPLLELAQRAHLDDYALSLIFAAGMVEEDHRFAATFEVLQGEGQHRPTLGLLNNWMEGGDARMTIPQLVALGVVEIVNPGDPRMTWSVQVSPLVWDALRGGRISETSYRLRWRDISALVPLQEMILAESEASAARAVAPLLEREAASSLVIRGPAASGRRTLAGALARELGLGLLELDATQADDPLTRTVAPLVVLLGGLPLLVLDLGPGETFRAPASFGSLGPVVISLGEQGMVEGQCMDRAVAIDLDIPRPHERALHWEQSLGAASADSAELARRIRMTGGNTRRTASLATAEAALAGHRRPTSQDIRRAMRTRSGQLLSTLAQRVPTTGDWRNLALAEETMEELLLLERRCRHREDLLRAVGTTLRQDLGAGVRALFTGPSGTGKTLAARTLASVLDVDLYRIDLSMIVNKYIGETEKNLRRIFARAEEADIALLLDEGDSLLTQRTAVESSHDRYANLETNYLLQRLESFEGILIVTSNAAERIDSAFKRRMDVVIAFYPPTPVERLSIWSLHLPERHSLSSATLQQVSGRCALTGGQIRNAVLHAGVLALGRDGEIVDDDVLHAVRREYRKAGEVFPLPEPIHG